MTHGFKKERRKATRYSLQKTFGAIAIVDFPAEYDVDAGLQVPDQNADGLPYGCTAETITDLATDQDKILFSPAWYFNKSCELNGLPNTVDGLSAEQAAKAVYKAGIQPKDGNQDASLYKRPVFWLERFKKDWFDTIREAMLLVKEEHRGVALGTDWYYEFQGSIFPENPKKSSGGHCYAVKGWTQKNSAGEFLRNGEVFLKIKPWQGVNYGDKGFVYMSRPLVNKLMSDWGACGFTLKDTFPGEIKTIDLSLLQRLSDIIKQLLELFNKPSTPMPAPEPLFIPPTKPNRLREWAEAIYACEDPNKNARATRNKNPGNLKYTPLTRGFGAIGHDKDNFCLFSDMEAGYKALEEFLELAAKDNLKAYHNARTLRKFTRVYALPPNDDYAFHVAKQLKVDVDSDIKNLL